MIRGDDQPAALRDVLCIPPPQPPNKSAKHPHNWTYQIERPLGQHGRIGARSVAPVPVFNGGAGLNQIKINQAREIQAARLPVETKPGQPEISSRPAAQAGSGDRHSTAHIGSIRIHGTQLLLVSSNQFDSWPGILGRHTVARFQPAAWCGENEASVSFDSRAFETKLFAGARHRPLRLAIRCL